MQTTRKFLRPSKARSRAGSRAVAKAVQADLYRQAAAKRAATLDDIEKLGRLALLEYVRQLRNDAQDVINNWERGDLAGAVNEMRLLVENGPELTKEQTEPEEIDITVEGGIIQDVSFVPVGVRVRVMDFDIEGIPDEETEVVNDKGERAIVSLYAAR